jgi:ElaB/YqjD/DUF883 family membrane-anchored ribosome-binding protein
MDQSATELRIEIEETRTNLGETLEALGDRVSPSRVVERRKNRIVRGLADTRDRIMGTGAAVTHGIADKAGDTAESLQHAPGAVRERSAGNPLVAGGVAFGVGVLVAAALPPTQKERELAETLVDQAAPLKEQATEAVREMAGHLEAPAREAAEEVKQAASEGTQHVTERVTGSEGGTGTGGVTSTTGTSTPGSPQPGGTIGRPSV